MKTKKKINLNAFVITSFSTSLKAEEGDKLKGGGSATTRAGASCVLPCPV